ncbi:Manganese transport regulator, partial [Dysosmobacter welbionis]
LLAPHGGVDDLRRADGGQVTVALVGEHRLMGMGALDAGSYGRRPAVGGLLHVAVEILVREDGAAHGAHADGVIQQTQLHQRLCHQLVDDAVVAAGAVVELHVRQAPGFLIYDRHVTCPPSRPSWPLLPS